MSEQNPLLSSHELPPFSHIKAEHIVPAITAITEANLAALQKQLESLSTPTWESLVSDIESRDDTLNQAWSPISHLNGVANSDDIRAAYEEALSILTAYNTELGQNKALYEAYISLKQSDQFPQLSQAQKQSIENAIRDFQLSGVSLQGEQKARYRDMRAKLSELSNLFSNNVLDATRAWTKHIDQEQGLAGFPVTAIATAKQAAEEKGLDGWLLTLDGPVYLTVMTQAEDRALRQEMYTAYQTRASDVGPNAGEWDNTEVIEQILQLRVEKAALLGFDNYSELSLAPKMAESTGQVVSFLEDLAQKAKPAAEKEIAELNAWVKEQYGIDTLEVWDMAFYSEKLKQAQYDVSQEEIRPYFTLPTVLTGLFDVAHQLFGITITQVENESTWHSDVRYFVIKKDNKTVASFYLDLFARAGKRGGAWMAECRVRRKTNAGIQLPVAFLVCNFSAPVAGTDAQLTHNEVTTLFHEFGHGLHHMLTEIDIAAVSGINGVAWDAVELPSQFMENWCWQPSVLKGLSCHAETGESLPDTLIDKLIAAKNFQSAMIMVRQLEFSLFDFTLHMNYGDSNFMGVQALLDEVRKTTSVVIPPAFNRFQNGFSHIFAGGYSAGYFSYKWAEVLSSDAFAAFEENGLLDGNMGQQFLGTILQKGGSEDAMVLFKRFRGREPNTQALLRHSGILCNG